MRWNGLLVKDRDIPQDHEVEEATAFNDPHRFMAASRRLSSSGQTLKAFVAAFSSDHKIPEAPHESNPIPEVKTRVHQQQ